MSIPPRPKFCASQLVQIVDEHGRLMLERSEVLECRYFVEAPDVDGIPYTGWAYRVTFNPIAWAVESLLRPLPPEQLRGFEDCAWRPSCTGMPA